MKNTFAQHVQRSSEISEEERQAARDALRAFDKFSKQIWAARQSDQRLVNVLQKNKEADPSSLFEIRHLLRRFQKEVRQRYANLIVDFAGKKDVNSETVSQGHIHTLTPLENDTLTRHIKAALQDAVQQLTEFMEEFLEAFEDFNNPDQITTIVTVSGKADQIVQSIDNIIDGQLKPHFEKNIIRRKKLASMYNGIRRRIRILDMLEEL
jgi:DNA-binding protein YbaB